MNKIRIVIADDHPIFVKGLRQVLLADLSLEVVAEARDGDAALQCLQEHKPDVVVLDIEMPKKDGFEVVRALKTSQPDLAVLFLTMHKDEALFNAAVDLGVQGYVLKDSALAEIVEGVRTVAAGHSFVSPVLSSYLLGRRRRAQNLLAERPTLRDLTPTERRVLQLIADSKSSAQIAQELFVSVRTVEHHRANICAKLSLHGSNALLRFALAHRSELA
jgi:DNA-binding NarL/FixJ family response regulator